MVVAQLVERSLPIPEVRLKSSHRRNFTLNMCTVNCWKDENKVKEAENGHFFKKMSTYRSALEATSTKLKLYTDESVGSLRQMLKVTCDARWSYDCEDEGSNPIRLYFHFAKIAWESLKLAQPVADFFRLTIPLSVCKKFKWMARKKLNHWGINNYCPLRCVRRQLTEKVKSL